MTRTTCTLLLALFAGTFCGTAQAAFVEIDTFETLTLGTLDGQNGWNAPDGGGVSVDPADGSNQVMSVAGTNRDIFKSINIADGSTATLFFRVRRDGDANLSVGTSAAGTPEEFSDFESQLNNANDNVLNVRDGGNFDAVDTIDDDTWLKIWQVIDNDNNTYEVYGEGGSIGPMTQLDAGSQTVFDFRNGGAAGDLVNFFVRSSSQNNGTFFVDDVYLDTTGQNLTDPTALASVPEPATASMILLGLMAWAARRRRR